MLIESDGLQMVWPKKQDYIENEMLNEPPVSGWPWHKTGLCQQQFQMRVSAPLPAFPLCFPLSLVPFLLSLHSLFLLFLAFYPFLLSLLPSYKYCLRLESNQIIMISKKANI